MSRTREQLRRCRRRRRICLAVLVALFIAGLALLAQNKSARPVVGTPDGRGKVGDAWPYNRILSQFV